MGMPDFMTMFTRRVFPAFCGCLLLVQPVMAEEQDVVYDVDPPVAGQAQPNTPVETAPAREVTFTIKKFVIEGGALFDPEELQRQVRGFIGRSKTSADVEGARDALERYFRDRGYPTVIVNIPEQTVQSRIIRLEIIENRIGTVTITGNSWFSTEKIKRDLPSLAPNMVIKVDRVQNEVNSINKHPDFKVFPDIQPGKSPETVDVFLKVKENRPIHGSLELNNKSANDTTDLRVNAALRYDNLWQREHSISAQYQMSPQKMDEVQVFSGSYTLKAPWSANDRLTLYGVTSNTKSVSAGGFGNLGKGMIIGVRAVLPLKPLDSYNHAVVLGFDYKDFEQTVEAEGVVFMTPISYLPFSVLYNGSLPDASGFTSISMGINVAFRGAVTNSQQFEDKRHEAKGNYITMTMGVERNQKLPYGLSLMAKLDGQVADQPLISNEQYSGGGMDSVRGYKESEASGDNALHAALELSTRELFNESSEGKFRLSPYVFYEMAQLWKKEPLSTESAFTSLQSTGIGMRGYLLKDVDFQCDLAFALRDSGKVEKGDPMVHFKVRYQF